MGRTIGIGKQSFEELRKNHCFYVDKTSFIQEWWESHDEITLITRPRRFGKTLNMDMLNCFFSNRYEERADLFEGLEIWKEEKYRRLQGKFPVIYLSFADVKQENYEDAVAKIKRIITKVFQQNIFLMESDKLTKMQKIQFEQVTPQMDDVTAQGSDWNPIKN